MKFTRRPIIIEAFQAGIDDIPEWFMDRVTSGEAILKSDPEEPWCIMMRWNGAECSVKRGDYIANSLFPFTTYEPEHFHNTFILGDNASEHSELMLEVEQAITEWNLNFSTKEEVYNSLHEDLRDLRRSVMANNANEITELLFQLAVTALKARKDLNDGSLCGVRDDE